MPQDSAQDQLVEHILGLAEEMLGLAVATDLIAEDCGHRVFCGIVRDCVYKLRASAMELRDAPEADAGMLDLVVVDK